jgi:ABC-type polysaccharide/polyol phosphate export permease
MSLISIKSPGFINAVMSLAVKTLKVRYKNSLLGIFWSMLNPLLFLIILYIVFSRVANENQELNYALYALSGLIFWNFISASVLQVLTSFIDNGDILKSVNLDPIAFPFAAMLAAIFNLLLSFIPFFIILFFVGYDLNWSILSIIPFILVTAVFITGLGMLLGTLNVYFRDIQLLWTTITPAFFYFTPIAYPITLIPERFRWLIKLNPFYYFIDAVHQIFHDSRFPSFENVCVMLGLAIAAISLGYYLFTKLRKGFISNI